MSYILDALRQAETDRQRGQVLNLNAPAPGAARCRHHIPRLIARWVLGLATVLGAVFFLGLGLQGRGGATPIYSTKSSVVQNHLPDISPLPGPPGLVAPQFAAPSRQPSTDTSWMQPQGGLFRPSINSAASERPTASVPEKPQKGTLDATPSSASMPRVTPRSTYTPVPEPPDLEPEPGNIRELPEEIRQQLPMISIGGSSYSSDPKSRMLIINGQIFREGDAITHDLMLERIERKSAVVKFKGARYRWSF
jgi:general secretion pathway protein B